MRSEHLGHFTLGEIPPPLEYQYLTHEGDPIDLTGYTVKFMVKERTGTAATYDGTLATPAEGKVLYAWTGTEWPTAGDYTAQFVVGNNVNRFFSVPIEWCVRAALGTVPTI